MYANQNQARVHQMVQPRIVRLNHSMEHVHVQMAHGEAAFWATVKMGILKLAMFARHHAQ